MRTTRTFVFLFILSLSPALLPQKSGKLESIRLFEKDLVFLGEGRRGPYILPDSLIIENSETVYINNEQQERGNYQLNYIDGEIRFEKSVAEGAEIRLIYKIFPYTIEKSFAHRIVQQRVFGAPTTLADVFSQNSATDEEDYAAQLSKSGSITRGVTVGNNRGLKVNSALNINVSGKVGDNVEVVAALTDQTTPIQPEGTTQNLQEIDKVFIQIKTDELAATMGDFQIQYDETQFGQYNRKLQGAMGEAQYDRIQARASAAISRGKYHSMKIEGPQLEGNQGPHQLTGDRGQIDIIILAGTERVFVDGELMIRGETNDYIIDYAAAQITFSRKRLITSDSRITVDFQYSDEQYRRNLYSASVKSNFWNDKIQLGAIYLHEADDKDNPLDFTLTEDYRRILENAGDDQIKAVIDGANYVGEGEGRYNFVDSIYVYAGEKQGEYNVIFSDVGSRLGNYEYRGNATFEYVGENNGRYAPVILMPLPKTHDILDFSLTFSPHQAVNISSEYALSNYDQNSFSDLDADDNIGVAQNWVLNLRPNKLSMFGKNIGRLALTGKYKKVNNTFNDIDRTDEVEYNRRWDLTGDVGREEVVQEARLVYDPTTSFSIGGEYGNITKGDYFKSNRWQLQNSFNRDTWPSYHYQLEHIQRDNILQDQTADWWRQRGDAEWNIWKFKPLFEYEGENKKENWSDSLYTGHRFDDITGGLEIRPFEKLLVAGRVSQRENFDYIGFDRFEKESFANTQNVQIELQRVREITAALDLTHRVKEYSNSTTPNSQTDLAELRLQITPWKRAVNANWNYRISNTATARKERVYIKVPEGEGNYRLDEDLNEYVYDPLGDHILRILTTDQLIPTIEMKTSTRVRLEPSNFFGRLSTQDSTTSFWEKSLSAISSESYVALEERTETDDVMDVYLLRTETFRHPENTILGYLQFRQDVFLFERSRDFSLRYRYLTRDELNNQFLEGGEERIERENAFRLTTRISKLFSSQSELTQKRTARFFNYSGKQNRDIWATQLNTDWSYTPTSALKIALEGRLSWEEDIVYEEPTKVQSYGLIPRVTYSLRNKGRLRGEFEWSYVDANPQDRVLPYEMANGRSLGQSTRWDLRFDYRINSVIQATLSYSGRNEPERERVIHTGRAQVTAAFR